MLAIDLDVATVRGLVLAAGAPATAGGYAQLGLESGQRADSLAARIAVALDATTALPVVICCHESHGPEVADAVAAAVSAAGFDSVVVEPRDQARLRANPSGGMATSLVGVDIPTGLLEIQPGLTVDDLAAVAGAGLGLLGDGAGGGVVAELPVAVWSPSTPRGAATPDRDRRSRRLVPLVLAAIVLAVIVGLFLTRCDDIGDVATSGDEAATAEPESDVAAETPPDAEPTSEPEAASEPEPTSEPEATSEPEPTPSAQPIAEPEPTPEPEPEPTVDPLADLPPLSSLPERGAVFRPPTLFLEGPVQTQEQADALYERAIAVVGPDNVVNNYVVRPDAPPATDGNVRVEQAVLFETASAVIADEFIPTLELGVAVMVLNPQVQMVVEGHTDSVGSDEDNLVLSQRRAEAVVDYLVSRGVDRARLQALGLGESEPVASNDTADGRQINRRIEVNLLDLLADQ